MSKEGIYSIPRKTVVIALGVVTLSAACLGLEAASIIEAQSTAPAVSSKSKSYPTPFVYPNLPAEVIHNARKF